KPLAVDLISHFPDVDERAQGGHIIFEPIEVLGRRKALHVERIHRLAKNVPHALDLFCGFQVRVSGEVTVLLARRIDNPRGWFHRQMSQRVQQTSEEYAVANIVLVVDGHTMNWLGNKALRVRTRAEREQEENGADDRSDRP